MANPTAKVCAVITEESIDSAKRAIAQAETEADLLELRLDFLRDFDFSRVENLGTLLEDRSIPAIITCRDINEGGVQKVEDEIRIRLLVEGAKKWAAYCDLEAVHYEKAEKLSPDLAKLIVSHHDFDKTSANLEAVYEDLIKLPAAIHKIATRAQTVTDTLVIFRLLERGRNEHRPVIAIAMNEAGLLTRLLGPAHGSFLTYAALNRSRTSAPGQLTCSELKDLYRLNQLTRQTAITGIIGKPVHHSASPAMHNSAFSALGLDMVYLPIEVDNLEDFFARFVNPKTCELDWQLRGFSVTIPHKVEVQRYLDEIDATAAAVGAVNTVVIDNGRLLGYNTDARGAIEPLRRITELDGVSCGVLGAGGAARAVVHGLSEQGAVVTVFARDLEKARPLAAGPGVTLADLDALANEEIEILINTTPVGMHGHSADLSIVPAAVLPSVRIVYDLVYNPLETPLLRDANAAGCRTIGGLDMLIAQAARQFELWTGHHPPTSLMREAALRSLFAL